MVGHLKPILACCYAFLTSDYDNKRFAETLREHCGFVVEFEWIGNSIGKYHCIVLEGEYVQGWYVKTLLCVCGGAERTLYMAPPPFNPILLPPISPVIVSDRRGWSLRVFTHPSVSSSSFSFLLSLLLYFSMHFSPGSIRHSSMQEVTSVVEGCFVCAHSHGGWGFRRREDQ